jgi:hypothetical protein
MMSWKSCLRITVFVVGLSCAIGDGRIGHCQKSESQPLATPAGRNAALIYWQSFALMPGLTGDERQRIAVAASTLSHELPEDLVPILEQYNIALDQLQRATTVAHCDWDLDTDDGPLMLLTHLQKARELSFAVSLVAKKRFESGDIQGGIDLLHATMKLARDASRPPLLISFLVGTVIERNAIDVLAQFLQEMSAEEHERIREMMRSLPASPSFVDCMHCEKQMLAPWLERRIEAAMVDLQPGNNASDVVAAVFAKFGENSVSIPNDMTETDVRESLQNLGSYYEEMAKIAALPLKDQTDQWIALEAKIKSGLNSSSKSQAFSGLLPTPGGTQNAFLRGAKLNAKREMLQLAMKLVTADGSQKIPAGTQYRSIDDGFELSQQVGGEVEHLRVGRSASNEQQ